MYEGFLATFTVHSSSTPCQACFLKTMSHKRPRGLHYSADEMCTELHIWWQMLMQAAPVNLFQQWIKWIWEPSINITQSSVQHVSLYIICSVSGINSLSFLLFLCGCVLFAQIQVLHVWDEKYAVQSITTCAWPCVCLCVSTSVCVRPHLYILCARVHVPRKSIFASLCPPAHTSVAL